MNLDLTPSESEEPWLHRLFEIGILLKAINGALEFVAGLSLFFISAAKIHAYLFYITAGELAEDPSDRVANSVRHVAQGFSAASQHFLLFYLLSHGIVKLVLSYLLYREKMWAFPAAISIFGLFVLYEVYRYAHTYSPFLLAAIFFDLLVILLIWSEYRYRTASQTVDKTVV